MPHKEGNLTVYSDDEKKAALRLAARIGVKPAARELGTYATSIRRFREQMPEYWSELVINAELGPKRKQRTAENLEDLAEAYVEREFEAIEQAEKIIATSTDGKELAALIRAMGASRGLAGAGARAYRGEDVQTVEHNINFAALEQAAQMILSRASNEQLPERVPNLAEAEEI